MTTEANAATPTEAVDVTQSVYSRQSAQDRAKSSVVTLRAFILGFIFAGLIAFLNNWLMTVFGVGTLGGIQMPFGSIFLVMVFVLIINGPVRWINRMMAQDKPTSDITYLVLACSLIAAMALYVLGSLLQPSSGKLWDMWEGKVVAAGLVCAYFFWLKNFLGAPRAQLRNYPSSTVAKATSSLGMLAFVLWIVITVIHLKLQPVISEVWHSNVGKGFTIVLLLIVLPSILVWMFRPLAGSGRQARLFSAVELMTIYVMTLFAAMISTPGCDNQFMVTGPALFYFDKPESGWVKLFGKYLPTWMAPGWNGTVADKHVYSPLYLGGLTFDQIPWHAWLAMITAFGIFMALIYSVLFFASLIFRKQWIENEALAFPLVQLPLQMVDVEKTRRPGQIGFWHDKTMWLGFALACVFYLFVGMHSLYPDFPVLLPVSYYGTVFMSFPDKPWSSFGSIYSSVFIGTIGISYLLNREVAFSFWFFFLLQHFELVFVESLGFPVGSLPTAGQPSSPTFITYQGTGGWVALALILVWTAREHLGILWKAAFMGRGGDEDEPFSARFMIIGFVLSLVGLFAWSSFAGINLLVAAVFFGIFLMTSLVISRLVLEGGLAFTQQPFLPMEWMTSGLIGTAHIGAANITRLSFVQTGIFSDMRTNVLPAFLNTMKIGKELNLDRKNMRRMLLCAIVGIAIAMVVTFFTTLWILYGVGGLKAYTWFTSGAPTNTVNTAATLINTQPKVDPNNLIWTVVGAVVVWLLMLARSNFLWFPLHPLGYIAANTFPIAQLWFSFFLGWLAKSVMVKYGGSDGIAKLRPFMIGLILGNLFAMIFWIVTLAYYTGAPIGFQAA